MDSRMIFENLIWQMNSEENFLWLIKPIGRMAACSGYTHDK